MSRPVKSRRSFIKTAAAAMAGVAASGFPMPALSQGLREWNMVMTWPKTLPGLGTGAVRLAERITKMSGGRLTVKIYGAGELVPALGVFDAVAANVAQIGHGASYYWLNKHKASAFFCAVPGGLTAAEQNAWLYFGGGQELWDELYSSFGLRAFPAGNTSTQMGGWYKQPVMKIEDIRGLKMRIPGLAGEVFTRLGGSAQVIPGGELFTALQSGVIDALEWVGPWNDMALGFHKIAPYYYGPGFHEGGPTMELMVNAQEYDRLPRDLQMIVKVACATENQLMASEYNFNNVRAFQLLRHKHKVDIRSYPRDVLKQFFVTSREVVEDIASEDPFTRKVYDSYRKFRKYSIDTGYVSEHGFMNGRLLER